MRVANILAGTAIPVWFLLSLAGRHGLEGVVAQQVPGYPSIEQINLYVVWPLFVAIALLIGAWLSNLFRRWPRILALLSGASLVAALPYLAMWGGGA